MMGSKSRGRVEDRVGCPRTGREVVYRMLRLEGIWERETLKVEEAGGTMTGEVVRDVACRRRAYRERENMFAALMLCVRELVGKQG